MAKGRKTGGLVAIPFENRLKRDEETGCLEWQGYRTRTGYGQLTMNGQQNYAHRVAYEKAYGPIPDGGHICHHCDNPPRCNPEHLFLGDPAINAKDRTQKGRTTCGEKHWNARFSEDDIRDIRERHQSGDLQSDIASFYGVDQGQISAIVLRRKWKHLP